MRKAYEIARGPFTVNDDQGDFIVMRLSDLDDDELSLSPEQRELVLRDYEASKTGEWLDANEALAQIRARHGL